MFRTIDLYLGGFLILCGFGISLLNLRSLIHSKNKFSNILLSENILLMCVGVAFMCRGIYSLDPGNVEMEDVELRMAGIPNVFKSDSVKCGFASLLLSYGPFVVSLVNSFLGLIIDNYMHYRMLWDLKKKDEEDMVQEIGETSRSVKDVKYSKIVAFWKKYFSFITIALQWIVPILIALFMYPMNVKELSIGDDARSLEDSCMSMLDMRGGSCLFNSTDWTNETDVVLRKYIPTSINYLEVIEKEQNTNASIQIDSILNNVFNVLRNFNNQSDFKYTNITKSARRPKIGDQCMKICFTDNKNMLVYMFVLAFISYFVPITMSTVILTKIHIIQVNRPNAKTYVTRELLYNVLFWSPVMFDTFLSLIMCSFSMNGMRTSFFNVVANVYQAVKNFMNTRYFKENAIVPN